MWNRLAVKAERLLRRRIKSIIYKRLYGGRIRFWESWIIRLYKHLPGAHPIVQTTLEGR